MPEVSICIPAYKNPEFLIRAVESVLTQTFDDYEIIITDDTPDESLQTVVKEKYSDVRNLRYYKNPIRLGSTANWNQAISYAQTNLIKLLHHDDWFASQNSLKEFIAPFLSNPKIDFVFCGSSYYNNGRFIKNYSPAARHIDELKNDPSFLLQRNIITSPSSTLYRKKNLTYDTNLVWLPDADFYNRYIKTDNFQFIPQPLVNVNVSENRLTKYCESNLKLLTGETLYLYSKYSDYSEARQNILKYLRIIIRNHGIYGIESLKKNSGFTSFPKEFEQLITNILFRERVTDYLFRVTRRVKRAILGKHSEYLIYLLKNNLLCLC